MRKETRTEEQIKEANRIFDLLKEGKKIVAKGKLISIKANAKWPTTNYTIATEKGLLAWFSTSNKQFAGVKSNDYVEVEFLIKGKTAGYNNAFWIFGKCPKLINRIAA